MNASWKPKLPPGRIFKKQSLQDLIKTAGFIYQVGESNALRQPSKTVSVTGIESPEMRAKIAYLKGCMKKYRAATGKGRGIAAVQVGIPERFSVIFMPERKEKFLVIINPVIVKKAKKMLRYPEMCMSGNGLIAYVTRPAWVEVVYVTEKGKKAYWDLKDETIQGKMYNRVLQHEIDHLNGVINIDTVQSKELFFESEKVFYEKATFQEVSS